MTQLTGRVALVTGGSKGLGAAIVSALADSGVSVVSTSRSGTGDSDPRIRHVAADVRNPADAARAVEQAVAGFGGLDILINNAGVGHFANVADMTLEQWRDIMDTNVGGIFHCCQAAIPHLRTRGGGWIINISSLASQNAFAGGAAYCASKAAVNQFSEALMQEVRHDNIRVSCVLPGSVETGFGRGMNSKKGWALQPEDVAQVVMDLIAMPARSLPSRVELRPSRPPQK